MTNCKAFTDELWAMQGLLVNAIGAFAHLCCSDTRFAWIDMASDLILRDAKYDRKVWFSCT